jgi:hypothetical protein
MHWSEKLEVLDRLATGEVSAVSWYYAINKPVVWSTKKIEKLIRESTAECVLVSPNPMQSSSLMDSNWLHHNITIIILLLLLIHKYFHVSQWLKKGFGLLIGFINTLQVITTINYYTIAALHNLQSLHTNLFSLQGLTIKSVNSTPCACHRSSGHKPQYGLMTLAYQRCTVVLLLIYGSLFLSGIY